MSDLSPGPGPIFGPRFSSFTAEQVAWLVEDYSSLPLERPVEVREADIQAGRRHYAEDLPIEPTPTPEYTALFDDALERNAERVGRAVAAAAAVVASTSAGPPTLVSLARAGVPAGIWLASRLRTAHGVDSPHYAISIVRDRGLDLNALAWLAEHHDPARVVFVDAWTGKGAIRQELTTAIGEARTRGLPFSPTLVVLADPAGVADIAGTSDDILIPTACLNSTSCGLVSRTVLPPRARAGGYHGAKFYREFAALDRSQAAVAGVVDRMAALAPPAVEAGRERGRGAEFVPSLVADLGLPDARFVKPGIGETTRVLQRRVPREVLVHPDWTDAADLRHIMVLAEERRVPVRVLDTGPYRCVGIVAPLEVSS